MYTIHVPYRRKVLAGGNFIYSTSDNGPSAKQTGGQHKIFFKSFKKL